MKQWKNALALALVYVGVFANWNWIWGPLFILWGMSGLRSGHTFFVEEVQQKESPLLFWSIVLTWLILGFYSLFALFL